MKYDVNQGFSNCGTRSTCGTPATVQWYTGLVRNNHRVKIEIVPAINAVT
jgi:hypothetical protein